MLNIIVAASENNAIGNAGTMPWHLSADLKYFKAQTTGHAIIMGRKTYESIGRPLPGRHNIVITHDTSYNIAPEVREAMKPGTSISIVTSLEEAISIAGDDAFITGGAQIYRQAWALADRLYITRVHTIVDKFDAAIPAVPECFVATRCENVHADEKNDFDCSFIVYERQ